MFKPCCKPMIETLKYCLNSRIKQLAIERIEWGKRLIEHRNASLQCNVLNALIGLQFMIDA